MLASHLLQPTTILSTLHLQNNEIISQNPEASTFTALEDSRFSRTDPRRYLNAESIPYLGPGCIRSDHQNE
jgi:hypothetical protein